MALLIGCLAATAVHARDRQLEQSLETMWEVMWHQTGMPTQVARWPGPIRYVILNDDPSHGETIIKALNAVTHEARVKLSEAPTIERANLIVKVVGQGELEDNEPCVTYLDFDAAMNIKSAVIKMRAGDVHRCAFHESMHLMGLRGHPSGETVLSYFEPQQDRLMPLDRAMLRGWYSPDMKTGMNPLQALPILSRELICESDNRAEAIETRQHFYQALITNMRAFVAGTGDIPAIVKKSGKSSANGISFGRSEMTHFLQETPSFPSFSELQCKSVVTHSAMVEAHEASN